MPSDPLFIGIFLPHVRNSRPNRNHRATQVAGRSWLSSFEANDYANFAARRVVVWRE